MRGRRFTSASVVSALLFVATCVLWVRSYSRFDGVYWLRRWTGVSPLKHFDRFHSAQAETKPGTLVVSWGDTPFSFGHPRDHSSFYWQSNRRTRKDLVVPYEWTFLGAGLHRYEDGFVTVAVPFWLAGLVCALPPLVWLLRRAAARRRKRAGCCPTCGYDLRATPGRCPECGRVPAGVGVERAGGGTVVAVHCAAGGVRGA